MLAALLVAATADGQEFYSRGDATCSVTLAAADTCPSGDCPDTAFDYFVTVTDQAGRESPPQRVHLIVTLFVL